MSVLSDTDMSHTLASQLFYCFIFCFIVLSGLAVGKTTKYDILKHPTRLHTTLSHNTCIQSLLASGNSNYTVL